MDVPDRFPVRDATDEWIENFERHATKERRYRRFMRRVPSNPRCKICYTPFGGFGRVMTRFGRGPSRKNPTMCSVCIEEGPEGGFETEAGVIFADVRGFTALAESRSPKEIAELMNRFYRATTSVLLDHEAIIDKLVGDEVMGVFWPGIMHAAEPGEEMVAAGLELLRAVGYGDDSEAWLALGAGIHFGRAFMGNVGDQHARDWTVLGDVVNTAARLQQAAKPGQLVVSESIYRTIKDHAYAAPQVELAAKGKTEPLTAYTFDLGPSEL